MSALDLSLSQQAGLRKKGAAGTCIGNSSSGTHYTLGSNTPATGRAGGTRQEISQMGPEALAEVIQALWMADKTFRDLGWHSRSEVTSAALMKIRSTLGGA